jgi:hypothetical protein
MIRKLRLFTFAGFLLGMIFLLAGPAAGQVMDAGWSPPEQRSHPESKAGSAIMVSDSYGFVHAFWAEQEGGVDSLQYSRFDGQEWSQPVNLRKTGQGGRIESIAAAVSLQGKLYLSWTEGNRGPILLIHAPAYDALGQDKWSQPAVIQASADKQRIQVDSQGAVHIIYQDTRGETPGVYYMVDRSGESSAPLKIDPSVPANYRPAGLDFEIDSSDGLHALWYYADQEKPASPGRWILYAQKLAGDSGWKPSITIDEDQAGDDHLRLPFPDLAVNGRHLVIVYAGDKMTRRFFTHSEDSGTTWSAPQQIFGELHGQAIGDGLTFDAAGNLHFLGQVRYPQGLYHATMNQSNEWSKPTLIYLIANSSQEEIGDRIHAHGVRLVAQAGNLLVTTFYNRDDREHFPLYSMTSQLDLQPSALRPIPAIDQETQTSAPQQQSEAPMEAPPAATAQPESSSPPGALFWGGIGLAMVIFGVAVILVILRNRTG